VSTRTFPANASSLSPIRAFVRDEVGPALGGETLGGLLLAVTEAASNAVKHSGGTTVTLSISKTRSSVVVQITDDGVFVRRVPLPELDGEGYRGIPLMMAVMDEVVFLEGTEPGDGTTVRLTKYV